MAYKLNPFTNKLEFNRSPTSSGSAAGGSTQVQYNTSGGLDASGNFTFNDTTNTLSVSNISVSGNIAISGTVDGVDVSTLNSTVSTLNSTVSSQGSRITTLEYNNSAYVAKTANYTLTSSDFTVNCTSGTFTLTLPTAVGISGKQYNLKNTGTGIITVNTTSSQTIDGSASGVVKIYEDENLLVQSNGANWIVL